MAACGGEAMKAVNIESVSWRLFMPTFSPTVLTLQLLRMGSRFWCDNEPLLAMTGDHRLAKPSGHSRNVNGAIPAPARLALISASIRSS